MNHAIRRIVAALFAASLVGLLAARGAVDEPIAHRIRKAVRLPRVNISFNIGGTTTFEWLDRPAVADPKAEIARLRGLLKNEPKDAEILADISRVSIQLDDSKAFEAAAKASVAAWRRWATAVPDDRKVQLGFAKALRAAGDAAEAERVLRRVVAAGDPPWETRRELASLLGDRASEPFFRGADGAPGPIVGGPAVASTVAEESGVRLNEAIRMADALVASTSSEPRVWLLRAQLHWQRTVMDFARNPPKENADRLRQTTLWMFPESVVPDLEEARRLLPNEPRLVLQIVTAQLGDSLADLLTAGAASGGADALARLPSAKRAAVEEGFARLDRIARENDPAIKAIALEQTAMLRLIAHGDLRGAGELARRALRLDPRRNEAFEVAMNALLRDEKIDWKLAEEIARERLKARPEARTRLMLVKIMEEQGRADAALAEIHAAMKDFPGNAPIEVAHMALRVQQGQWPGTPGEGPDLDKVRKLIEAMPDGEAKGMLYANFVVTAAATVALGGDAAGARQILDRVLQQSKDDGYANAMASLLKQLP